MIHVLQSAGSLGVLIGIVAIVVGVVVAPFRQAARERKVAEAARAIVAQRAADKIAAQETEARHRQAMRQAEDIALGQSRTHSPVVEIAVGTGRLIATAGQSSGIPDGRPVRLDADLASRGTCVVAPSGAGKSRGVLQPFAAHWLTCQSAGMFAFCDKPNWGRILVRTARFAGRTPEQIHIVGPGARSWPLLRGLSPDAVAGFIERAGRSEGSGGKGEDFFTRSAANLVRRIANVLSAATSRGPIIVEVRADNDEVVETIPLAYDLRSISRLTMMTAETFDLHVVPVLRAQQAILDASGDVSGARKIANDLPQIAHLLGSRADNQREGVIGTIDSVLAPFFTEESFEAAFSSDEPFDLSVLDEGHAVVLEINKALFPSAYRLAFLLAFEQMRLYMISRISRQDDGEDLNAVLFLCDEYAQVADKSHMEMWRVSREAHIAPLVAYQIHTDLQGSIGREVADGMMQNFATRIVWGTSDPASIALVSGGKAEVQRISDGVSEGSNKGTSEGENTGMNFHAQGFGNSNGKNAGVCEGSNKGTSITKAWTERSVVDQQLMFALTNRIRRGVPLDDQVAEVVVRTVLDDRLVLDVCKVKAWDPPRLAEETIA